MSETVNINFIVKGKVVKLDVPVGTTILEAAHNNDVDLEGACEGSLACSTCHVIVDDAYFNKLSEPSEDEEDMLDLAFGLTKTSRLGCQIVLNKDLDGITVEIPDETRNLS
jgi:2Fe-2S ferredoxin